MIEDVLSRIARQIMTLDEETLTAMVPRYKTSMLDFTPTREWEESVIIYFLINGLRTKNSMFNEKIKAYMANADTGNKSGPHIRPRLRLMQSVQDVKKKNEPDGGGGPTSETAGSEAGGPERYKCPDSSE